MTAQVKERNPASLDNTLIIILMILNMQLEPQHSELLFNLSSRKNKCCTKGATEKHTQSGSVKIGVALDIHLFQ